MVSVCYAVATWFSVHFQRPIEHDFGDRASHVGKQVFPEHGRQPAVLVIPTNAPEPLFFWRPEHPILSLVLPSALTAVIPSGEILTRF